MRKFITDEIVREAQRAYDEGTDDEGTADASTYYAMERALRAVVPLLLEGLAEDVRDQTDKVTRIRARAKI